MLFVFTQFIIVLLYRSSLLDQGMLVNIQQPVIQADGTLLLATDSKVHLIIKTLRALLPHSVLCFFE